MMMDTEPSNMDEGRMNMADRIGQVTLVLCCGLIAFALWAIWPSDAEGQTRPGDHRVIAPIVRIESGAIDAYTIEMSGRTLDGNAPTVTVILLKERVLGNDATPANMVQSAATSGSDISFSLDPDNTCSPSGCRKGNWYQVRFTPTDSAGNTPTVNLLVQVQDVNLSGRIR
jgi:hypothetical protein